MIKEKFDGAVESEIITSMILDAAALGLISSVWKTGGDLFSVGWLNMIASWCIKHYENHRESPRRAIEGYFLEWSEKSEDPETVTLVSRFLASISEKSVYDSEKYSSINPDRILDMAGKLFRKNKINKLIDRLQHYLRIGKEEEAEECITSHTRIELGGGSCCDPIHNEEEIRATFSQENKVQVITFPGDVNLAAFFANEMEQEGFLVFCSPQKCGKSISLINMAYQAVSQRKKVAMFVVGDMSARQVKERLYSRIALHPTRSVDGHWPLRMKFPTRILPPTSNDTPARVTYEERVFQEPLEEGVAIQAVSRLIRGSIKSWDSYLLLSCHPSHTISMGGIRTILEQWETQRNFYPDVVIIDYMDNLRHDYKTEKQNDKVNMTWKLAKSLTAEKRCLLLSATQVNAEGFKKRLLDRSNFSEDNRKLSEVTGLVGINVVAEEKEMGIVRYNWIVKRYGEFSHRRVIHCAGHYGVCCPTMVTTFPGVILGGSEE